MTSGADGKDTGNYCEEDVVVVEAFDQVITLAVKIHAEWEGKENWHFDYFEFEKRDTPRRGVLKYQAVPCWTPKIERYLQGNPAMQATVKGVDLDNNNPYEYNVNVEKSVVMDNFEAI